MSPRAVYEVIEVDSGCGDDGLAKERWTSDSAICLGNKAIRGKRSGQWSGRD